MTDQEYAESVGSSKNTSSLVLFFASDYSQLITGKTLLVDGEEANADQSHLPWKLVHESHLLH